MRYFLCVLLLSALACGIIRAETPISKNGYFCTKQGTVLNYERYAPDGKHWWNQKTKIDSTSLGEDGTVKVGFTSTIKSFDVKAPIKGSVSSAAFVRKDGTVEINIAEAAATVAKNRYSAFRFKASGGMSSLSPNVKPGDKLEEIHGKVECAGMKLTIDYTERVVLRKETVKVPAGTFDCIVVQERKVEKAPLMKRENITLTWYALGYGFVRHDSLLPDGSLESSEQLVSITN